MRPNNIISALTTFFAIICFFTTSATAQIIHAAVYFDGYWSRWERIHINCVRNVNYLVNNETISLFDNESGPWTPHIFIQINGVHNPDRKTRKKHYKSNTWYVYEGIIRYYVCSEMPKAHDIYKAKRGPLFLHPKTCAPLTTQFALAHTNLKLVTSKAIIKIAPYKGDKPIIYNIWFDNVAIGIDVRNYY